MTRFFRALRSDLTIALAAGFLAGAGLYTVVDGQPTADAATQQAAAPIAP